MPGRPVDDVRAVLGAERARLAAEVSTLTAAHDAIVASRAEAGTDDEHDPDGATLAFERAQVAGLLEDARRHLAALHDAERRMLAGTYGTCERCGDSIGAARLHALPATATCVACADRRPGLPR